MGKIHCSRWRPNRHWAFPRGSLASAIRLWVQAWIALRRALLVQRPAVTHDLSTALMRPVMRVLEGGKTRSGVSSGVCQVEGGAPNVNMRAALLRNAW